MSINDLDIGQTAYVKELSMDSPFTKRLLSLGCIKGTKIKLKKIAPFGDPILINFHGFDLAIRKKDAANIQVTATKEE
ncbi:MAG: ferrous iron transport protein A [Clostridia bacterium]|nr:ferrous iron transport protein A [Clostridia bacterium]